MPHTDGMEATAQIRGFSGKQPTIIAISASVDVEITKKCMDLGCDSFLTKPVVLNQLLSTIENLIKIEWCYSINSPTVESLIDNIDWPETHFLEQIIEAASLGRLSNLKKTLQTLRNKNRYTEFCQLVEARLNIYDFEGIIDMINHKV
jgi:CheY-like chemotaxis protein